jgi:hypothetical protein
LFDGELFFAGRAISDIFFHASPNPIYYEGLGCFFHDKMIAPVLLLGRGLLPPRKAKHGVGSCWSESFK